MESYVRADFELTICRHRIMTLRLDKAEPGKVLAEISGWLKISSYCSLEGQRNSA